jgi:polynucleotide 5'-kinase involved in rRNA processing
MCSRAAHTAARATGESPEQPDAIGAAGSDNNLPDALPADALDDRIAIVGTAGSGKTYAAKGFVERLLEMGARVAIVDPLVVW